MQRYEFAERAQSPICAATRPSTQEACPCNYLNSRRERGAQSVRPQGQVRTIIRESAAPTLDSLGADGAARRWQNSAEREKGAHSGRPIGQRKPIGQEDTLRGISVDATKKTQRNELTTERIQDQLRMADRPRFSASGNF